MGKKGRITGGNTKKEANPAWDWGGRLKIIGAFFTSPLPCLVSPFPPPVAYIHLWQISSVCFILRKLSHPHIVKFYGTSLFQQKPAVKIILVLEWCTGNLKNHIFNNQELIPGKSGRDEVIRKVCQWIKEITDALAYIHEQGIIHRDLKLENVLVRCNVLFVCSELNRLSSRSEWLAFGLGG